MLSALLGALALLLGVHADCADFIAAHDCIGDVQFPSDAVCTNYAYTSFVQAWNMCPAKTYVLATIGRARPQEPLEEDAELRYARQQLTLISTCWFLERFHSDLLKKGQVGVPQEIAVQVGMSVIHRTYSDTPDYAADLPSAPFLADGCVPVPALVHQKVEYPCRVMMLINEMKRKDLTLEMPDEIIDTPTGKSLLLLVNGIASKKDTKPPDEVLKHAILSAAQAPRNKAMTSPHVTTTTRALEMEKSMKLTIDKLYDCESEPPMTVRSMWTQSRERLQRAPVQNMTQYLLDEVLHLTHINDELRPLLQKESILSALTSDFRTRYKALQPRKNS